MPRKSRIKSKSNVYHVMLRGINRQQIFEEDSDYMQFIEILRIVKDISNFKLHAYCLMGNHVHLLIQTQDESIELIMKRLEVRFVHWYNKKYKRTGSLFDGRYKTENVETDKYFLTALRYILQNPVKAGICNNIYEYPWSAAIYYKFHLDSFITVSTAQSYFSSKAILTDYLNTNNFDICMDASDEVFFNNHIDNAVKKIISEKTNCLNLSEFQKIDIRIRNKCINELINQNIPICHIARLTGLSKSHIYRLRA